MTYNNENIFARIIKGEADCVKILENDYILSFIDVILIERIDCMLNDIEWENKIFSLINGALNSNLRIYISSNVVAKDLDIGLKDLISRLSYFTGIEIPEISQREKIEAIKQSATRKGLKLDDSTINYILNHYITLI